MNMKNGNYISFEKYYNQRSHYDSLFEKLKCDLHTQKELLGNYCFVQDHKYRLFLFNLFYMNHEMLKGINPNAGFLVGFSDNHIENIVAEVKDTLQWMERDYVLFNARGKTFCEMVNFQAKKEYSRNRDAFLELKDILYVSDKVVVIQELSKCKSAKFNDGQMVKSLIKIINDAHLNNINPSSDLVFIDYACCLQNILETIETYINISL